MKLIELEHNYSIGQVTTLPDMPKGEQLYSLTTTVDEISLICRDELMPTDAIKAESGWMALKVDGVLDFALSGVLSRMLVPLAHANIEILAFSTYNTDYLLLKRAKRIAALQTLQENGMEIERFYP